MPEPIDQLNAVLAGQYVVERELGAGGMATVYLAHDVKHDRRVALKVLRPDLAAALGPERFTREIRIAAQLQHPHILPLHDSGEAGGFLYYVMPYVEGESLRERLTRSGELPIDDAVRFIREIVDALAHAHERGLVHRDLKPDNVMLAKRHALVMDFGVAKAVSEATGRQELTTAGVALGTPAYMAPEQATADPQMDHRADIYAVGVVAYELLTGSPPFGGPNAQAILSAQVMKEPEHVTARRASVPAPLADLVMRCLAKKPADRWQSADDMLAVLEGLTTTSGGITPTHTRPLTAVRPRHRSIALIAAALVGAGALAAAGLLLRGGNRAADAPPPVDRQVTFRGDVAVWGGVALAEDGRTIAYTAARGQELIVQDLAGGGSNTVVRLDDPTRRVFSPYWGPGGARVFFELGGDTVSLIASVPRLGGPLRIEVDLQPLQSPGAGGARFEGFAPSGEYVLTAGAWIYVGNAPETLRWVEEDSLGGDGTLLRVAETGRSVFGAILSPDGGWIAYSTAGLGGRGGTGLISTDGTHHVVLPEGMGLPRFALGWSVAGDAVYYQRLPWERSDIVRLPIDPDDGRPAGEPVFVMRAAEGVVPSIQGTTLLYVGGSFSANLKAVDLAGAPRTTEHPTSMLTSGTAFNVGTALSPDGEMVAFLRRAGLDRSDIYVRPTRGGAERSLPQPSGTTPGQPYMSRDGRRIAYVADDSLSGGDERRTFVIVELASGRSTSTELPWRGHLTIAWSPDGQRLAISESIVNRVALLDLRDATETSVELQCDTACALQTLSLAFSPDGTRIALTDALKWGLWIATLPSGHATPVADGAVLALHWTEDWIYFTREETAASGAPYPVIYRVSPEGGIAQLYARLPEDCADWLPVSLSLDASTAVCGVSDPKRDVHIVEHFDRTGRR